MKYIIANILIFALFCCSNMNNEDPVQITQLNSDYHIIIKGDTINNRIVYVQFFLKYEIKKINEIFMRVSLPHYYYNCKNKWVSNELLYSRENNDTLIYINKSKKRILETNESIECVVKTVHYADTTKATQVLFVPYIDKMKREGKDTLHIETVQQLKQTKPELINKLLKGDSIVFNFALEKGIYWEKLAIEVE